MQVAEHCHTGYPNPPLDIIFIICKNVLNWLESDENNIVIIHCQSSQGRSALIMSCILSLMQLFGHPGEALTYFCKLTGGNDQKILFPSQSLYLKYFANVLDGIKLNYYPLTILKIIFNEIPSLTVKPKKDQLKEQPTEKTLFPYCQIFSNSEAIYNSIQEDKKIKPYTKEDLSLWFDVGTKVDGDILIRIRHFESDKQRLPLFRIMLHTGFIFDNVARFYKKDLDIARYLNVSDNFFIDIIFQQAPEEMEEEKIDESASSEKRPKKHSVDDIDFIVNSIGRKNNQLQMNKEESDDSQIYKSRSSIYSNQSDEKECNDTYLIVMNYYLENEVPSPPPENSEILLSLQQEDESKQNESNKNE